MDLQKTERRVIVLSEALMWLLLLGGGLMVVGAIVMFTYPGMVPGALALLGSGFYSVVLGLLASSALQMLAGMSSTLRIIARNQNLEAAKAGGDLLHEIRVRISNVNELLSLGQLNEALSQAHALRGHILAAGSEDPAVATELKNVDEAIAVLAKKT
ncbi:MAG: hypothetical protein FJX76_00030 [Armatimonadetes bacterium]|nr:hypothetical protein [Armatimonadota bacterium]